MPEDPGDAEVSGSGGIDDDGLGLDAWVSDDGPAGVDGRCGDGASPSPRSCPFPCSSSCPSSSRRISSRARLSCCIFRTSCRRSSFCAMKSRSLVEWGLSSREVKLSTSLSYPFASVEYWKGTERGGDSMKVTFRLSTTAPVGWIQYPVGLAVEAETT